MKDERKILLNVVILLIATCLAGVVWAVPMGTAFTYQGCLMDKNNKQPAKGEHDFEFLLYDANDLGTQIGSTITKGNVNVKDGFFAVSLDFAANDPNAFNGDARWLEIAVRPGDSTDPCDYDTLSPRTELALSPYAFYSKTSGTDNDLMVSGDDMYSIPSGNVGIGTSSPEFKLTLDNDGGILAKGSYDTGTDLTSSGEGARLIWYPKKAAFRAGYVNSDQWDDANIDNFSVGMGFNNKASGWWATISGGSTNITTDWYATIAGGHSNTVSQEYATIGGGRDNTAGAVYATISGGRDNVSSGDYASVGGGCVNTAAGDYATVPGGQYNWSKGNYSFTAGYRAKALHDGTFVWADSNDADFESTANDQFLIRASGGVGIGTNSPNSQLHVVGNIKMVDGNQGDGKVLTSDADGVGTWQAPPASGIPSGGIIMWSGSIASIPSGWALCDGTNGTPDLTSQFIRSVPNSSTDPGSTGGSSTHTHSAGSYSASNHSHTYSGTTDPESKDPYCCICSCGGDSVASKEHTHDFSGTTSSASGGTVSGTSGAGNSLPPFYELDFIMRTGS